MISPQPVIRIRDLKCAYDNTNLVLKSINLDIETGQIIGYVGPNGAGKTTTVKILTGMLDRFTGEVTVLGQNMAEHPVEVKRRIGYVPENTDLYESLTPQEYLEFLCRLYGMEARSIEERIERLLRTFNLVTHRHERMSSFSKGMKQKVLIISGMIHNPDVIFLDEPLSGLDANTTILVKKTLRKLAAMGKTIFYCSHIMDVVERLSDRIVIVNEGQIIADGSFEELRSMSKGGTLETVFMRLTGKSEDAGAAERIAEAIGGLA